MTFVVSRPSGAAENSCKLRDNESISHTRPGSACGGKRSATFQQRKQIGPERVPRGCTTRERARNDRREQRKRRHAPVDVQLVQSRDTGRRKRDQAVNGKHRETRGRRRRRPTPAALLRRSAGAPAFRSRRRGLPESPGRGRGRSLATRGAK